MGMREHWGCNSTRHGKNYPYLSSDFPNIRNVLSEIRYNNEYN